MSKIEKVLILMIVTIVIAYSLIYREEVSQHEKDVNLVISRYDSLKVQTFRTMKLVKDYDSISNDAIDSAKKYKKLYLKNK